MNGHRDLATGLEVNELLDSAENLLAELGAAGSDGWATRSVHVDDIDRLRAAIVAVENLVSASIPSIPSIKDAA